MRRIKAFKEMKNECLNMVHTAAIAYGLPDTEVSLRRRHMRLTVYAGRGAVAITLFDTGRMVLESAKHLKDGFTVLSDEVFQDYLNDWKEPGKSLLVLVESVFDLADEMYRTERTERREQRKAAKTAEAANTDDNTEKP